MLDVPKALQELQKKDLRTIESETAYTWASRALASRQFYRQTNDMRWLLLEYEFGHEAIEHAAFAQPGLTEEIHALLGW
jgi:hypothetical protein